MLALKAQKKLLLAGTARFNKKPKTGLAFLEEKGLIPTVAASDSSEGAGSRSKSLARFLKQSPRLDKKLLGEFISRKENIEILKEFIGLYDFRHVSQEGKKTLGGGRTEPEILTHFGHCRNPLPMR